MTIFEKNAKLVEWAVKKYKLEEQIDGSNQQFFGPFTVNGGQVYMMYDNDHFDWQMLKEQGESVLAYTKKRDRISQFAQTVRDALPRSKFVASLIAEAIRNGITERAHILDAVNFAANMESIKEAIDSDKSADETHEPFGLDYIKSILARYRGDLPQKHKWYLSADKIYHLH